MCGLLFTNDPSTSPDLFLRGLHTMDHRGPDSTGCYTAIGPNQLGHNRLAIIDLDERSRQPYTSHDGRYTIVYNGEIYNFRELAQRFRISVRTTGDTEVLIELYARLGASMVQHLNGMFAFVIVDHETNAIFAARDRLGIKPLYYHTSPDGHHTFSSEISALLELHPNTQFDEVGLRQYRKLRTFFNGRTLYRGISMFPAGSFFHDGRTYRYWELPEGDQEPPSDEELQSLVRSAVSYRSISDVPVGSYLSGGLDSTIVAGLADEPHTWTVGSTSNNEFEWARIAARRFGSQHHEVLIDDSEFLQLAKDLITTRREPLSVPNEVLLYKMTRAVSEFNTVILSGEGADELFFGYDRIFRWAASTETFDLREFDRFYAYGAHRDDEIIEDALSPFIVRRRPISIVAAFFQVAHLHGLLRRLDNSTMRCSVEGRVPFVDHRLVERMAGVSFEYRMSDGIVKAPLKRVFTDLVPPEICNRVKVGFPVDLDSILRDYGAAGDSPVDKWFNFNLEVLGAHD